MNWSIPTHASGMDRTAAPKKTRGSTVTAPAPINTAVVSGSAPNDPGTSMRNVKPMSASG